MKNNITPSFLVLILAIGFSTSAKANIVLYDYAFNFSGAAVVLDDGGFDYGSGLGNISLQISGAGPHSFSAFFDHEITDNSNPYDNESGSASGSPLAGQSWEIDEPGYVNGDIYINFLDGLLDNAVGSYDYGGGDSGSTSFPDDVSMAMGWDFSLADGETATIMLMLGTTAPEGFFLSQTDASSSEAIFFSSVLEITSLISPVPVPAAAWLFASGLLGMIGARRRFSQMHKSK
jgi:hypothetical protein